MWEGIQNMHEIKSCMHNIIIITMPHPVHIFIIMHVHKLAGWGRGVGGGGGYVLHAYNR